MLLCDGNGDDIFNAKLAELENWKKNEVFEKSTKLQADYYLCKVGNYLKK